MPFRTRVAPARARARARARRELLLLHWDRRRAVDRALLGFGGASGAATAPRASEEFCSAAAGAWSGVTTFAPPAGASVLIPRALRRRRRRAFLVARSLPGRAREAAGGMIRSRSGDGGAAPSSRSRPPQ